MHVLFTPWRYEYLTSQKSDSGCIFCNAVASDDEQSTLTLFRGQLVLVMLNRYPYTNGHLMVAPVRHASRLDETNHPELSALIRVTAFAQKVLSDAYRPDGFNIGMNIGAAAGAGIADHYHMHVVPRWAGDTNFMSVSASTRLVPQELEQTRVELAPRFVGLVEIPAGDDV
jgi:ATP adenylyltransferase